MKAFIREFKEFIARGNVMTMAVGIIIGSAFTAIVTSLNQDIITPLLGLVLGQINFAGQQIMEPFVKGMDGKKTAPKRGGSEGCKKKPKAKVTKKATQLDGPVP